MRPKLATIGNEELASWCQAGKERKQRAAAVRCMQWITGCNKVGTIRNKLDKKPSLVSRQECPGMPLVNCKVIYGTANKNLLSKTSANLVFTLNIPFIFYTSPSHMLWTSEERKV